MKPSLPRLLVLSRSFYQRQRGFQSPAPPSLPPEEQKEFERLQRLANQSLSSQPSQTSAEEETHPDFYKKPKPEFDGETNPNTGEVGGPKNEPVKRWVDGEGGGEWSFGGKVSDF
ncbi:hypothetical protein BT69DRAFT_1276955 [Atractiella rhizophila]|nr:hypothetical protein BT69DRAFT_1276955 [Atractiella rhizophila]